LGGGASWMIVVAARPGRCWSGDLGGAGARSEGVNPDVSAHALPAVCLRGLPPAPAAIAPVAVAFDAGCALVVVGPGRRVVLRPRPRVSYPPGAQVAPGTGVTLRGGHVVVVRAGRVLWRSQSGFHAGHHRGVFTTISAAQRSGRRLAYVVSRWKAGTDHPLLFVTAGRGRRERLVSHTASPLGWTPRGLIAAELSRRRVVMHVWRADGRSAAPALTLAARTWTWDWSTNELFAVTAAGLVRSDGVSVSAVAPLRALAMRASELTLAPLGNGLMELAGTSQLIVFDASGHQRNRASLPGGWRLNGTITAERNGTIAFEATPTTPLSARTFRLYAAVPGGRQRLLDHYTVPPECVPDALALHGSSLLLSATGLTRLYDTRGSATPVNLEPAVDWLRARHRTGQPRLL
jgi:hypothetical protein